MLSLLKRKSVPNAPERAESKPGKKVSLSQKIKIVVVAVLLALCLSAALAYYVHSKFIVDVQLTQLQTLTSQRAELAADNVRAWLDQKQSELSNLAKRPLLLDLLKTADAEALEKGLVAYSKNIEGIQAVKLIRVGEAKLDTSSVPPIRYTELAMINSAMQGENVKPELARIDNNWQINFVQAILTEQNQEQPESIQAVLLIVLNTDQLKQTIERTFRQKAGFTLVQKVGNADEVEALNLGAGDLPIVAESPVPSSWWQLKVQASKNLLDETLVQSSFIYSMLGAFTLTLSLLAYLAGRFIGGRLDESGKTVTKGITELVTPARKDTMVDPLYQKKDILDIEIKEKDEELLGLEDQEKPKHQNENVPQEKEAAAEQDRKVPASIFRAYDIRGIARSELTKELAEQIGQALGSEAIDNNENTLIVARDARAHSPELCEYLIRGILKSGCDVLNIGTVPTPVLYYATETLSESSSGVMVTASHNAAEYNGFKVVINGVCRAEEDIKSIRSRILSKNVYEGQGSEARKDITATYIDTIFSDVALAGDINLVVDAGNGVTGVIGPRLFEELGCQVTPLFCDLDGTFPNHSPDPSVPENLEALIAKVKETRADLGIAFDGDGDRIVVVTGSGKIIWPDRLLMLFAKDIISRNPGSDVVFDVKSTRQLVQAITSYGGRPIMWKTGHAPMKSKMAETGALLGGEFSGHIFIKDRWYGFDDGLYAAARLLEIITLQSESLDKVMEEFPETLITPEIRVKVKEENKFTLMQRLSDEGNFGEAKITNIDGIRAEFSYGWGLVRASNTSPNLTMRFEADDEASMHKLKSLFVKELRSIDPSIQIDWD